jgi:hypothetical protein
MKELKDIRDDQIRIVGEGVRRKPLSRSVWIIIISIIVLISVGVIALFVSKHEETAIVELKAPEPALFEPEIAPEPIKHEWIGRKVDSLQVGFTEIRDTLINDIPIRIFIPHNAEMTLHIGRMDKEDKSVIYAAQAADVRADNGEIVGAFVHKGKPISWGKSKKGYCASINGKVYVGVAEITPLFEMETENEGYFFRQYALVDNGKLVENNPKGKTIRRAICQMQSRVFMVESLTRESFHDFAQALVDLGVNNAIYLVGSTAYGWSVDQNGITHEHGEDIWRDNPSGCPKNVSYIVWKRK